MLARILKAQEIDGEFRVQVHLDQSRLSLAGKVTDNGRIVPGEEGAPPRPDPEWLFEAKFPLSMPPEVALDRALVQARARLIEKMRAAGLPIPHPLEGQVIDLLRFVPAPDSIGDTLARIDGGSWCRSTTGSAPSDM